VSPHRTCRPPYRHRGCCRGQLSADRQRKADHGRQAGS